MVTRMINESGNYVIKTIEGQGIIILETNEFYKKKYVLKQLYLF